MHPTTQQYVFQTLCICFMLYVFVAFIRQHWKEEEGTFFRRHWLFFLIWLGCWGWFFYGIVFFIDAPIHACGNGYCGKTGLSHTENEFNAFQTWQSGLFLLWPVGMGAMLCLRWNKEMGQ